MALQNSMPGLLLTNAPVSQPNSGLEIPVGFPCNCATGVPETDITILGATAPADTEDARFSYLSHIVLTINGTATSVYFNANQTPYIYVSTSAAAITALRARYDEMMAQYFGTGATSIIIVGDAELKFELTADLESLDSASVVANGVTTAFA